MEKDKLLAQVDNALAFLGQAQVMAPTQSDLWKEIGRVWDEVDTLKDMIEVEEYNQDGKLI